ncbi:MAG: hypothetical protein KGJ35_00770 [Patescibacteria group bacterium]|nr:hypothetical protein [Patescibacteria group bacterium]
MNYADFWKGKRVAVVGLGPRGEMRADIRFLQKTGIQSLAVYDMRGKAAVRPFLVDLTVSKDKPVEFSFGSVSGNNLSQHDLIILSPDIPRSVSFLKEIKDRSIQIEYPDVLALKLAPAITVVGVMGSCGKTAIINMLSNTLKKGFNSAGLPMPLLVDCESTSGSLSVLSKAKKDSLVLIRMPDYLLAEYDKIHFAPHIAIMAVSPAVKNPFALMAYQTYTNFLITTDELADAFHDSAPERKNTKIIRTSASRFPSEWHSITLNQYEREDAALVLETASLFKIDRSFVKNAIEEYAAKKNVGGMRFVKKSKGVLFYDDSLSDRPEATVAALRFLSGNGDPGAITLIMGGATVDTDYELLLTAISQYARQVVLVPGSGTVSLRKKIAALEGIKSFSAPSIEAAVKLARSESHAGDRVLYSPALAAAGYDRSRPERGERFVKAVRGLW